MIRKSLLTIFAFFILLTTVNSQDFITRNGDKLSFKGEEILLRGMAFGNLVWEDGADPADHHSEIDYQRVNDLGMNVLRFYLNYETFEYDDNPYTYKESGWDWIDKNIEWAKANDIFLILNMHVPQGGFQSQCEGDALWTNPENQSRLAALWKEIATRYKNEPQIAGFDILNEPTPSGSVDNWTNLAQRIIDSIRSVDNNHLIITERAIALGCDYTYSDENNNYPQITEENLMYTVHLYDPHEYTHQNLDWAGTGDGGKYPDKNKLAVPADAAYATGHYANPSVTDGTSDWTYYEGTPYTVNHDSLLFGRVVFLSNSIEDGQIYFDDYEVQELSPEGEVIRTIPVPKAQNFWWWSQNETGSYSKSSIGHDDNESIMVTGNTGSATVICSDASFKVKKGNKYLVNGWMKGENIPSGASASVSMELYHSPSGGKLESRGYEYLKKRILQYSKYIEEKGYPVYFGEFGAARTAFVDDKGGERWVADALKIFDSLGYHFTYHSYKESSFGYYDGWKGPVDPSTVNKELEKVFRDFFDTATGFENFPLDNKDLIKIIPNPAVGKVLIDTDLNFESVDVTDATGNVVLSSKNTTLNVSELEVGIYYLRLRADGKVFYSKLLKQ